jgi:hypothetical protein
MAKGDRSRVQNQIDYSTGNSQNNLDNLRTNWEGYRGPMQNFYMQTAPGQIQDYNSIMKNYSTFANPNVGATQRGDTSSFGNLSDPNAWMSMVSNPQQLQSWLKAAYPQLDQKGLDYYTQHIQEKPGADTNEQAGSAEYWLNRIPEWFGDHSNDPFYNAITKSLGGYGNFAETGGFSPQDVQDIRARMISPIRSIYSSANRAVDTQRRLQHGYSPNYTAAKAKMAREQAYATSDATTNANAALAQMIQSGKLAGLGGLASTGGAARSQNLSALGGQTNLYNASPGQVQTFGNQVLQTGNQGIDMQRLQQAIDQMRLSGTIDLSKVPSDTAQTLGYIGDFMGLIGQGANALSGSGLMDFLNKKPVLPSRPTVPNTGFLPAGS